ncbi:MAG: sporulation protein YunB [Oscillospiraceae bacterium]|nr:sporulation protein YunB [Oscillospiraceae bacterium]
MYYRRRKPKYTISTDTKKAKSNPKITVLAVILLLVLASISLFLRDLSTKIAVSDAVDIVTKTVNDSINKVIGQGVYGFDYFVSLVKDDNGDITAITSDMAHINTLSTEILNSVISSTENGTIEVKIPMGNLSGLNLLMGRGPNVPIDIIMLTSSRVDFRNDIVSSGINQAKYQLILEVTIDIDVLVPWGTESATTVTEVIVADTVIVGKVPETYLNMEN